VAAPWLLRFNPLLFITRHVLLDVMGPTSDRLILIGFMGTGKSTVAEALAEHLGFSVRELDALIVERSGRASIPAIFEHEGETHFRNLETEVCVALRHDRSVIISTGGGVIGRDTNMENLTAEGGTVIFLRTTFEKILTRSADLHDRPLFKNGHQARELYERRGPAYLRWANLVVDTDEKSIEEICSEILSSLQSQA
jgi:shikimate kinase